MAITITRLEAGIYRAHLADLVEVQALLAAQAEGAALAEAHGDDRYALIIDIDRSVQMPFDIRHAGEVVNQNQADVIISVGASLHIRFIASLLGSMFGLNGVEHVKTLEHAVQRARQRLNSPR